MEFIYAAVGILVGMFLGICIGEFGSHSKTSGTLRVDRSDPTEEPYLFLELQEPVSSIISKSRVTLKVNVKNFISQK